MDAGMRSSETTGKLSEALARAQAKITGAKKDSANPFFHSHYADLASVWDACRVPLTENGLAISQSPMTEYLGDPQIVTVKAASGQDRSVVKIATKLSVVTRLSHASGEWLEGTVSAMLPSGDPQSVGSAITYLRRYALASMVGVAPEDDDGEGAMRGVWGGKAAPPKAEPKPAAADADVRERKALLEGLAKDLADWPEQEIADLHQRVIHRAKPDKASGYSLTELRALKAAAQNPEPPAESKAVSDEAPASAEQKASLASEKKRLRPDTFAAVARDVMGERPETEMSEADADAMLERLAQEPDSDLPKYAEDGVTVLNWVLCPKGCSQVVRWKKGTKGNLTVGLDGKPHLYDCPNK